MEQVDRPGLSWRYQYDAFGRRIKSMDPSHQETQLFNDGDDRLSEYDGSDKLIARTIFASLDEPLARIDSQGNVVYYLAEGLGSITGLTDGSGNVTDTYAYDAWGKVVARTGSSIQPFSFTGREEDGNGLLNYRNRYYNPATGRFTQQDPLGFSSGDQNFYLYVENNPITHTDPSGLLSSAYALNHYLSRTGTDLSMRFDEINTNGVKPSNFPKVRSELKPSCEMRSIVVHDLLDFTTSGDTWLFLGNITLKLNGRLTVSSDSYFFNGFLSSKDDLYDFNKSTHRSKFGEWLTSIGRGLPGKVYTIHIKGSRPIIEVGSL